MPTVERDISIGEAGEVSIGDLHQPDNVDSGSLPKSDKVKNRAAGSARLGSITGGENWEDGAIRFI